MSELTFFRHIHVSVELVPISDDKVSCSSQMGLKQPRAQWLSGRVLDSRPRGRGLEPHRRHCVVVLEQDTFILA